ncbi:MAG TPA: TonB-dependent receptor [Terriglobales bacterium]|nr:TonB-dependent receptor [Terriglobales bacterium]
MALHLPALSQSKPPANVPPASPQQTPPTTESNTPPQTEPSTPAQTEPQNQTIASAQNPAPLKEMSLEQLGNIQVTTVSKEPEEVWKTPAAVYVITQEDIRRSGYTSIPDILRLAPGVIVAQNDSNRWAIGIRGFNDILSRSVLVLIDGRSVYTPFLGGVHWAIQDLLISDIERIEVIRGPGGSIWGANAVNGVINVITKNARDTHGPRVQLAGGSVEQGRASFRYGAAASSELDYRIYGKWFTRGEQYHFDNGNFDDWRSGQGGMRFDWNPTAEDQVMVSGDIYKTITGERANISFFVPPSVRVIDGRLDLSGGNVVANWTRRFAGGSQLQLQSYYDRTNRIGPNFNELRQTVDVDFNHNVAINKRNTFSYGAGARVSPSRFTMVVPTLNFEPNEHTHSLYSGFLQDEMWIVPEKLSITAGLKFEHNSYTGPEFLPSARILWRPSSKQSLWAAFSRTVRTPTRFERDLDLTSFVSSVGPTFSRFLGKPIESETLVGYEAGYRQLIVPSFYLDLAGFFYQYDKLAEIGNPTPSVQTTSIPHNLLTFPFVNGIEGTGRGFEITPDWKPSSHWQLKGSYSYLRLFLETDPATSLSLLRDIYAGSAPHHQARIQSRINLPRGFEFDQTYRFVGEMPIKNVPKYHTVDVRFAWNINDLLELSVVGQNLLQPHHLEFSPVGIRRSAYAQLRIGR